MLIKKHFDHHGEAAHAAEALTFVGPKVSKSPCQQKASTHKAFHAQIGQNHGLHQLCTDAVAPGPRFSKPDDAPPAAQAHVLSDFTRSSLLTFWEAVRNKSEIENPTSEIKNSLLYYTYYLPANLLINSVDKLIKELNVVFNNAGALSDG